MNVRPKSGGASAAEVIPVPQAKGGDSAVANTSCSGNTSAVRLNDDMNLRRDIDKERHPLR